jgi:pimeloyl-ACP methyl ester carboxylesterase
MMNYPTEERITGVSAPVLVMRGAKDPVATPGWCRRLAERAPRGQLVEIEGSGHVVQHNRAVEVAEAIVSFAGLPAGGKAPQEFKA